MNRYFDAGATEVVFTQTSLTTDEDRLRTWRPLGELARGAWISRRVFQVEFLG